MDPRTAESVQIFKEGSMDGRNGTNFQGRTRGSTYGPFSRQFVIHHRKKVLFAKLSQKEFNTLSAKFYQLSFGANHSVLIKFYQCHFYQILKIVLIFSQRNIILIGQ